MKKNAQSALMNQRETRGSWRKVILWGIAIAALLVFPSTAFGQVNNALPLTYQIDPPTIAISNGDGRPKQAQVNLTLSPMVPEEVPLDLLFIVDRSATTDIEFVREVGELLLNGLPRNGRIGLVSFAETATVDVDLTDSAPLFRAGLEELRNIGKTAVGDGLFAATDHFVNRGRPDAAWVAVLLTDGRANAGLNPRLQAERAADNGIQIITVGMGHNPDETLLRDVAESTGGSFFREFSFRVLDEVANFSQFGISAEDINIVETLAPGIVYEEAVNIPPTRISGDPNVGTRLEWHVASLPTDESLTISYRISATREGLLSVNQDPSDITFTNFRGSRTSMPLPRLTLEVLPPNRSPVPAFTFTPDEPTTTIEVEFKNESFDPDGNLVEYFWNFGDGNTSPLREPKHRYERDGTYQVSLTVFDNLRASKTITQTLVVETRDITIVRNIDTFLSTDVTLVGEMFRVTLDIQVNKPLNGMGITEAINQGVPADWVINSVSHDAAKFKQINTVELQWVYLEVLNPGDRRIITYEVTLPDTTSVGTFVFNGVASSVSPSIEVRTRGDAQVEVRDNLSILTVVSRWDPPSSESEQGDLNMTLTDIITFDQVQVAVAWWLAGDIVPHSGGRAIDFGTIQMIIAHWLTNTPITEALPGADGSDDDEA